MKQSRRAFYNIDFFKVSRHTKNKGSNMTRNSRKLYSWRENEDWYEIDEETGEYSLTDEVP